MPEVCIIGAAKAGTTTLADALRLHPQVHVPRIKELAFYSDDSHYQRGFRHYRSFFPHLGRNRLSCDASPQYLFRDAVPERMAAAYRDLPLPVIIVILRNPVDRAYSSYWQAVALGFETRPFADAVAEELRHRQRAEADPRGRTLGAYLHAGLYGKQLSRWLDWFPRKAFLFQTSEELQRQPWKSFDEISQRLKITPFPQRALTLASNRAKLPQTIWLNRIIRGSWRGRSLMKSLLPPLIRHEIKRLVDSSNMQVTTFPPMDNAFRETLKSFFQPDYALLTQILNRTFPWDDTKGCVRE